MTPNNEFERLLTAFNQREEKALNQLFKYLQDLAVGYAEKFLDSDQDIEEVASDAIIRLWRCKVIFENMFHLESYFLVVVRNRCLDYLSKQKKTSIRNKRIALLQDPAVHESIETKISILV